MSRNLIFFVFGIFIALNAACYRCSANIDWLDATYRLWHQPVDATREIDSDHLKHMPCLCPPQPHSE